MRSPSIVLHTMLTTTAPTPELRRSVSYGWWWRSIGGDNTLFAHLFSRKRYVIVIGRDRSAAQHGDCVRVSIDLPRTLSSSSAVAGSRSLRSVVVWNPLVADRGKVSVSSSDRIWRWWSGSHCCSSLDLLQLESMPWIPIILFSTRTMGCLRVPRRNWTRSWWRVRRHWRGSRPWIISEFLVFLDCDTDRLQDKYSDIDDQLLFCDNKKARKWIRRLPDGGQLWSPINSTPSPTSACIWE